MTAATDPTPLRRHLYLVLIVVAVAVVCGRILSADRVYEPYLSQSASPILRWPAEPPRPVPTFGSNDRSRWATIRTLVEQGTYVVGTRRPFDEGTAAGLGGPASACLYGDHGLVFDEPGWQTID